MHAVGELGAGAAHSARDAEVGELGRRPAVEDDDVVAGREHRVQLLGRDRWRAELVLDHLPERLAGDVDAADQREAGRRPGVDTAVEHRDIAVAEVFEPGRGPFGLAGPGVAHHDGCGAARDEPRHQALQPRECAAARVEDVRVVERADLACVEQRELVVADDHASQLVCGHCVHGYPCPACHRPHRRRSPGAIQRSNGSADSARRVSSMWRRNDGIGQRHMSAPSSCRTPA